MTAPTASARDAATPRTDKLVIDSTAAVLDPIYDNIDLVPAEHARTLERELAALQRPALSEERIAEIAQECWDKWQHDEDAQVYAAAAIRQALKESGR